MPEASADDVRVEIDTHLDDSDIEGPNGNGGILARVERDWKREYDTTDFEDTQHIQDFEASLAALRIAEGRDRRAEEATSGRTSTTYETAEVDRLRKAVRRLDPGRQFGFGGNIIRDDNRHVSSTSDS